jgi:hypothetical protein
MEISSRSVRQPSWQKPLCARLQLGLVSGSLAILVNTAMLIATDHLHIMTARGGLLKLLMRLIGSPTLPITTTWGFQQFFHIIVGIAMGAGYAVLVGDIRASPTTKGLLVATVVWLANACIVLPLIGQGLAGSRVLTVIGMLTFVIAHTVFFLILAQIYERWKRHDPRIE